MANIHFLPTFLNFGTFTEGMMVADSVNELQECAEKFGADYVYVAKNKTGAYRPLTFAFYAEGGKFLARRTMNTVIEELAMA
jgi:hypothetical protein